MASAAPSVGFMSLPAELLFLVYALLGDLRDVAGLACTNQRLRQLFLSRRDEIVDWIIEASSQYRSSLVLVRVLTGQIEGDPRHNLPLTELHEVLATGVYAPKRRASTSISTYSLNWRTADTGIPVVQQRYLSRPDIALKAKTHVIELEPVTTWI